MGMRNLQTRFSLEKWKSKGWEAMVPESKFCILKAKILQKKLYSSERKQRDKVLVRNSLKLHIWGLKKWKSCFFFSFLYYFFFPAEWTVFIWRIFLFFISSFSSVSKMVNAGYLPEAKRQHSCEQQLWRRYCNPSGWSLVWLFHHIIFANNLLLQWRLRHVNVFILVSLVIRRFLR